MSFQTNFRQFLRLIWLNVAIFTLLGLVTRSVFLLSIANVSTLTELPSDVLDALIVGSRFDLRVAAIAFAPLLLIGLLTTGSRLYKYTQKIVPIYGSVIFFLQASTAIGNYFYYKTYHNHFDIFIFGLVEDDTKSVLASLWIDYPIIKSFLASVLLAVICSYFANKYKDKIIKLSWPPRTWYTSTLSITLTICAYFIAARGSLGTFPLGEYHTSVSQYEVLNKVTPNPLLAYSWAADAHNKDAKFSPVERAELTEKLIATTGQDTAKYQTPTNNFLAQEKPNVVLALMESMGTNILLNDDEQKTDLLGALRQPFEQDFVFERFLAGTNSTIGTVAMTLFHSNTYSISRSSARKVPLTGSAFLPFKAAGYKVIYVTGGSPTWRKLDQYFPLQGVDEQYSEIEIKKAFPESEAMINTWGVPDEFTFKFIEQLIAQNSQPIAVVLLTQSNHSPYTIPASYQPKPLELNEYILDKLSLETEQANTMLSVFQYSNNALGEFIGRIKTKNNQADQRQTIIAATGDHRSRSYKIDFPHDLGSAYNVPFYLHVPEKILNAVPHLFDKNRVGSHRDIFPTLYSLSLSNTAYHTLGGRNLMAQQDIAEPIAYNESVTMTNRGVFNNATPEQLYRWKSGQGFEVHRFAIDNPLASYPKEYNELLTLYINSQVKGFK